MRRLLTGLLASMMISSAAGADTLTDALISAYQTSDSLKAAQAGLRGQDESVEQARSGAMPQVNLTGSASRSYSSRATGYTDNVQVSLVASLLIYDGGQTKAAIAAANARVAAARAQLQALEQNVLLNAVTAYMDVRRDAQMVTLSQNNIRVLQEQVRAARDRFSVGEVTRTDVSQAEARLAAAQSSLAAAQGSLTRSQQSYIAAVGRSPTKLAAPPALPDLPKSVKQAEALAMKYHPDLNAARYAEIAALHDLERSKAGASPTVSARAQLGITDPPNASASRASSLSIEGNVPLYTGGRNPSLIRQAQAIVEQRKAQLQDTGRNLRLGTASAWAQLDVSRASIRAQAQQIEAAKLAYDGINEEAKLGARTTLDVLNAEQELLRARSDFVSAKRDEYVAVYSLLASVGLLTVKHLGLGIETYDANVNYRRAQQGKTLGFDGTVVDRIKDRWNK